MNTSYQSDYDIMVIISKPNIKHVKDRLKTKVTPKYDNTFAHRRHASPQLIVESIDTLNNALSKKQYFFTDIVKKGIKMYDTKEFKLAN